MRERERYSPWVCATWCGDTPKAARNGWNTRCASSSIREPCTGYKLHAGSDVMPRGAIFDAGIFLFLCSYKSGDNKFKLSALAKCGHELNAMFWRVWTSNILFFVNSRVNGAECWNTKTGLLNNVFGTFLSFLIKRQKWTKSELYAVYHFNRFLLRHPLIKVLSSAVVLHVLVAAVRRVQRRIRPHGWKVLFQCAVILNAIWYILTKSRDDCLGSSFKL